MSIRNSVGSASSTATTVRPSAEIAMPASGRGVLILPSSFRFGRSITETVRVLLVLGVEPLAVRRDDQPVAVGRAGIDRARPPCWSARSITATTALFSQVM